MARVILDGDILALSGREKDVVYTHRASGTYVRRYVKPTNPRSPAQQAQRARMTTAMQAWAQLMPPQIAAWEQWAQAHPRHNRLSGEPYAPSAYTSFLSLTLCWLQVNDEGTPPALPPSESFGGDVITITASGEPNAIVWQASGTNQSGIVTELRAQSLGRVRAAPNMDRAPVELTTTFPGPSHAVSTSTAPGLYAVATRFAVQNTGEVGEIIVLPHVWVGT